MVALIHAGNAQCYVHTLQETVFVSLKNLQLKCHLNSLHAFVERFNFRSEAQFVTRSCA